METPYLKALLLSGGIDSSALAFLIRPDYAFFIDYGQKPARREEYVAKLIANDLSIPFEAISVDCSAIGSGDLSNRKRLHGFGDSDLTEWWPFRNQLLLTLAAPLALELGVKELVFGSVKSDSHYKDGTINFFNAIRELFKSQEGELSISTPAINLSSVELVKKSEIPLSILGWTHSCHISNEACGLCRGCEKHLDILQSLNVT